MGDCVLSDFDIFDISFGSQQGTKSLISLGQRFVQETLTCCKNMNQKACRCQKHIMEHLPGSKNLPNSDKRKKSKIGVPVAVFRVMTDLVAFRLLIPCYLILYRSIILQTSCFVSSSIIRIYSV